MTNSPAGSAAKLLTVIAALIMSAAIAVAPAFAQTTAGSPPPGDTPSVGVTPTETHPDDPNKGQWFVFALGPGESGHTEARIGNPANIPQTITLYLADLVFGADGTPSIPPREANDVGTWGKFDQPTLVVPPKQFVRVGFTVTVPQGADPGDHVGAVVAESAPEGTGSVKVIKRVATRLYVTVPGDATKSYAVTHVTKKLTSFWFPSTIAVKTLLRNTGRVRLNPDVRINGVKGEGTPVLLAQAVEGYTAYVKAPWYGGPMTIRVRVQSEAGPRTLETTLFVIPWGLLALLPLSVLVAFALRKLNVLRIGRVQKLQADLRRLEGMVTQRPTGEAAAMAALAEQRETLPATEPGNADGMQDRIRSLREAFKRAHRNGAQAVLENTALALHEVGVDSREDLKIALEHSEGAMHEKLAAALASYDAPVESLAATPTVEEEPPSEVERPPGTHFLHAQAEPEEPPRNDPSRAQFLARLQSAFDDEPVAGRN